MSKKVAAALDEQNGKMTDADSGPAAEEVKNFCTAVQQATSSSSSPPKNVQSPAGAGVTKGNTGTASSVRLPTKKPAKGSPSTCPENQSKAVKGSGKQKPKGGEKATSKSKGKGKGKTFPTTGKGPQEPWHQWHTQPGWWIKPKGKGKTKAKGKGKNQQPAGKGKRR